MQLGFCHFALHFICVSLGTSVETRENMRKV